MNILMPGPTDITVNHKPSGGLYLSTDQENLINALSVQVLLDTVLPDFADGIEVLVDHEIIPGVAGLYVIDVHLELKSCVADTMMVMSVYCGGKVIEKTIQSAIDPADYNSISVSKAVWLSDTDDIELWIKSMAGVDTVDVVGGLEKTYLTAVRVR